MADAPKKGGFGTPFIILSFVLVFFILFDIPKGIRQGTADLAGFILEPTIGFGGKLPLLTIFLASVVLVVATTAVRHFLVDWTKMARVQEAMRSFSGEMKEARKSNNTYKLKKLTEAQGEVMQLQSSVQMDQMKPMALTMLIVIPIFAWLGAFLAVPVIFGADDVPTSTYAIIGMEDQVSSYTSVVGPSRDSFSTSNGAVAYAMRLDGPAETAALAFHPDVRGDPVKIATSDAPMIDVAMRVAVANNTTHEMNFYHSATPLQFTDSDERSVGVQHVVVAVKDDLGWRTFLVGSDVVVLTPTGDGEIYVLVPTTLSDVRLEGRGNLVIDDDEFPVTAASLVPLAEGAGTTVMPLPVKAPWTHAWDVLDQYTWITGNPGWFPRWIVLYSLFGIPFGQIAQRALKLWEYRKVDLDGDGKPAGDSS